MAEANDEGTAHQPRMMEIHLWEDRWGNHRIKVMRGPGSAETFEFGRVFNSPEDEDPVREPFSASLRELASVLERENL